MATWDLTVEVRAGERQAKAGGIVAPGAQEDQNRPAWLRES